MCNYIGTLHTKALLPFQQEFRSSENFAIRFNYFIPFSFVSHPTKAQKKQIEVLEKKWFDKLEINKGDFKNLCERAIHKQRYITDALSLQGYSTTTFPMKTSWRFVPGLGTSHINETGLALDHVCGLPFLGGSACKGVTREYVLEYLLNPDGENDLAALDKLLSEVENIQELIEKKDKGALKEKTGLSDGFMDRLMTDHDLQKVLYTAAAVFGSQHCAGRVIFLDAFPESLTTRLCIMNPHHAEYYSDRRPWPDDCEKPVPIKFAAVENAQFSFALASRDRDLLDTVSEWLKAALEQRGAGAKASAGYGYFTHEMSEILDLLASEDTGVAMKGLSRARKFIENNQIADNEKLKVAEAVENFDPTVRNINKKEEAMKKATRAARRYIGRIDTCHNLS